MSISDEAIELKRNDIRRRLKGLLRVFPSLVPEIRRVRLKRLRRDIQRLRLLNMGIGSPPTPVLDLAWAGRSPDRLPLTMAWLRSTSEGDEFVCDLLPEFEMLLKPIRKKA